MEARQQSIIDLHSFLFFLCCYLFLADAVIVQFKVSCPNLPDNTSVSPHHVLLSRLVTLFTFWCSYSHVPQVCVVGSSSKLGNWKIKDGHKLSYAGDSIWKAEVAIPIDEFPIKYPLVRSH